MLHNVGDKVIKIFCGPLFLLKPSNLGVFDECVIFQNPGFQTPGWSGAKFLRWIVADLDFFCPAPNLTSPIVRIRPKIFES